MIGKIYMRNCENGMRRFYDLWIEQDQTQNITPYRLMAHYGRIGNKGRVLTKGRYRTASLADSYKNKLIREKERKGYKKIAKKDLNETGEIKKQHEIIKERSMERFSFLGDA